MNVGQHRAPALQHADGGAVGDVGAHAPGSHKARTFAQEHADDLGVQSLTDLLHRGDAAVAHEEGIVRLDAFRLQPLADHGQYIRRVGLHR